MKTAFLLLMFVTALHGWAQSTDNKLISLELKEVSLGEALKQFSNVSGYKVNFPSEDVGPPAGTFVCTSENSGGKTF